ncbi:MAG: glycosyltransferase family 39 protein [Verrucomicrobia bacterium]|nr:glycosyltransferase family 39 protein [Verrucomicrobiota bacterium]
MSTTLQKWIHTLEEGKGSRVVKITVAILAFAVLALVYDMRCFNNFSTSEAMDVSQVARNISEGHGFTTDYIRPLSLHLVEKHREDGRTLAGPHPDLANAPAYPLLLAGYMKIAPFDYEISTTKYFGTFHPEIWIAIFNQLLFFIAVLLVYSLGKKLFDPRVGWLAAILFALTELFWQFSVAGVSTMLALVLFLGLVRVLLRIHELGEADFPNNKKLLTKTLFAGLLLGLLFLTRYSFGWLVLPVLFFIGLSLRQAQIRNCIAVLFVFLLTITPWLVRNYSASGTLFGTAGYAVYQQTAGFPGDTIERTLNPDRQFSNFEVKQVGRKVVTNAREAFSKLPLLGGNWLTAFFLVGLLIPFQRTILSASRIFILMALLVLLFVQSAGATHTTPTMPDVSGENLLIVLAPLIFIFGVGLFFILLDRLELFGFGVRSAMVTMFTLVISLPMIFELLPPRKHPGAFPPYHPPLIQHISQYLKSNELMMSDIPAAVAWYGDRPCTILTLTYKTGFLQLNDDFKTINALYISPRTLNQPFLLQMYRPLLKKDESWERFALESLSRGEIPGDFPLKHARADLLPDHLFLADWERWR